MRLSNPEAPSVDQRIARTAADGLLLGRDQLLYRPGDEPAPAELGNRSRRVAIGSDHCLELGNGLRASVLRGQEKTFGVMRNRVAGPDRQALRDQLLCARDAGPSPDAQLLGHPDPA